MAKSDVDIENLGCGVSKELNYNGADILKAFEAALTDANFHNESEIVHMMRMALESDEGEVKFALTMLSDDQEYRYAYDTQTYSYRRIDIAGRDS